MARQSLQPARTPQKQTAALLSNDTARLRCDVIFSPDVPVGFNLPEGPVFVLIIVKRIGLAIVIFVNRIDSLNFRGAPQSFWSVIPE